jgi:hypothetical protein
MKKFEDFTNELDPYGEENWSDDAIYRCDCGRYVDVYGNYLNLSKDEIPFNYFDVKRGTCNVCKKEFSRKMRDFHLD